VVSPVLANLFLHYAFDAWMAREFPDCPFERYADDAVVHCTTGDRARQVLAALEERMSSVGLRLHPDKTKIVYCKDANRRGPWNGPVSFDFLGYTFRARGLRNKHGQVFTGFGPAASAKAIAKMSETVVSWRLHQHLHLSWKDLIQWIGPVIRGWMNYYGRYYRSQLYPLLSRINHHIQRWLQDKHNNLRSGKVLWRTWHRVITQYPNALPHWKWVTNAWW
jgi:RNA-directed DNA polymerase